MPDDGSLSPSRGVGTSGPVLALEPSKLELGDVEVLHAVRHELTLVNECAVPVPYTIVDLDYDVPPPDPDRPGAVAAALAEAASASASASATDGAASGGPTAGAVFSFVSERNGTLFPYERRALAVSVRTLDPGRHLFRFAVKSPLARADILGAVGLTSVQPVYLHFPSLAPVNPELDLGNCYVDASRAYAQVTQLVVESRTTQPLYVTCSSNLAKQVFVFADEQLHVPVVDVLLPALGRITVFVALQPSLAAEALLAGQCRLLTGGIRFDVFSSPAPAKEGGTVPTDAADVPKGAVATAATAPTSSGHGVRRVQMMREVLKLRALIGQAVLVATPATLVVPAHDVPNVGATYHGASMCLGVRRTRAMAGT